MNSFAEEGVGGNEGASMLDEHPRFALLIEDEVVPSEAILDAECTWDVRMAGTSSDPSLRANGGRINSTPILSFPHLRSAAGIQERGKAVAMAHTLGVQTVVLVGWGRPLSPVAQSGRAMLVTDHINLLGDSPLVGMDCNTSVERFPDMTQPYQPALLIAVDTPASPLLDSFFTGVYLAAPWATFEHSETVARARAAGAHCVGPCIVPHVIAAVARGIDVFAMAIMVDTMADGYQTCHPSVQRAVSAAVRNVFETAICNESWGCQRMGEQRSQT